MSIQRMRVFCDGDVDVYDYHDNEKGVQHVRAPSLIVEDNGNGITCHRKNVGPSLRLNYQEVVDLVHAIFLMEKVTHKAGKISVYNNSPVRVFTRVVKVKV